MKFKDKIKYIEDKEYSKQEFITILNNILPKKNTVYRFGSLEENFIQLFSSVDGYIKDNDKVTNIDFCFKKYK